MPRHLLRYLLGAWVVGAIITVAREIDLNWCAAHHAYPGRFFNVVDGIAVIGPALATSPRALDYPWAGGVSPWITWTVWWTGAIVQWTVVGMASFVVAIPFCHARRRSLAPANPSRHA